MHSKINNVLAELNAEIDETLFIIKEKTRWTENLIFFNSLSNASKAETRRLAKAFTTEDALPRITWDNEFKMLFVNDHFLKATGYKRSQLIGKYIIDKQGKSAFIIEEDVVPSINVVTVNMENGLNMIKDFTNRWYNADGEIITTTWLGGFNDEVNGIGSSQCEIR